MLILLALFSGCRSGKEAVDSELSDPCAPGRREIPRILLLNFEVFENDSIVMINSALSQGKIRGRSAVEKEPEPGDLIVTFLTSGMIECSRQVIHNPLRRRVEFSDEYQQIRSRTITLDAAIFAVRAQFTNNLRFARVQKVTEDGKIILTTITLQ
jgi:hypothetical protein